MKLEKMVCGMLLGWKVRISHSRGRVKKSNKEGESKRTCVVNGKANGNLTHVMESTRLSIPGVSRGLAR